MKKSILMALTAGILSVATVLPAFAAGWQQGTGANQNKWWYENADGSYTKSGWQTIDGNGDGIAEHYYFDASGWMLASTTTPDGYTVNADGQWVQDGTVVTVKVAATPSTSASTASSSASSTKAKTQAEREAARKKLRAAKNVKVDKNAGTGTKTSGPIAGSVSSEDFDAYQNSTNSVDAASAND